MCFFLAEPLSSTGAGMTLEEVSLSFRFRVDLLSICCCESESEDCRVEDVSLDGLRNLEEPPFFSSPEEPDSSEEESEDDSA